MPALPFIIMPGGADGVIGDGLGTGPGPCPCPGPAIDGGIPAVGAEKSWGGSGCTEGWTLCLRA